MESSSLTINLDKFERVYRPRATIEGSVDVHAYKGWQHQGLKLIVEGKVFLNYTGRGQGLLEFSSALKPTVIYNQELEIAAPGRFNDGTTNVPFSFVFAAGGDEVIELMESYHGVFVSVVYIIQAVCDRGRMKKAVVKELEFIIEIPTGSKGLPPQDPMKFDISKDTLENVSAYDLSQIPPFKITGNLHQSAWNIALPFTGEVRIEESESAIKSVELQLVRVESVIPDQGNPTREATEIQTIQIGEGNISRNMIVPMYMVFPRLFSCPTIATKTFKLEWEVNLIVLFDNGYMVTENFPVTLYRDM